MIRLRFLSILAAMIFAVAVQSADPTPVKPNPFPTAPTVPPTVDPPKPDPDAVAVLDENLIYIVKSDENFTLRAVPKGLVKITRLTTQPAAAPAPTLSAIAVFGKFVGGDGKFKLEQFKEKNVAVVTSVDGAKGRVTLIYSPEGAKDDSSDIERMIDVNGPRPPPIPVDPKVDPKVDPVPVVVKTFRVIFVYDKNKKLTPEQHSAMYATSVNNWLIANTTKDGDTNGFRRKDWKESAAEESPAFKAIWTAVQPQLTVVPCVVIEVNGHADIVNYPASAEASIALLDSYRNPKK